MIYFKVMAEWWKSIQNWEWDNQNNLEGGRKRVRDRPGAEENQMSKEAGEIAMERNGSRQQDFFCCCCWLIDCVGACRPPVVAGSLLLPYGFQRWSSDHQLGPLPTGPSGQHMTKRFQSNSYQAASISNRVWKGGKKVWGKKKLVLGTNESSSRSSSTLDVMIIHKHMQAFLQC